MPQSIVSQSVPVGWIFSIACRYNDKLPLLLSILFEGMKNFDAHHPSFEAVKVWSLHLLSGRSSSIHCSWCFFFPSPRLSFFFQEQELRNLANELLPPGQLGLAYRSRLLLTNRHLAPEVREALAALTPDVCWAMDRLRHECLGTSGENIPFCGLPPIFSVCFQHVPPPTGRERACQALSGRLAYFVLCAWQCVGSHSCKHGPHCLPASGPAQPAMDCASGGSHHYASSWWLRQAGSQLERRCEFWCCQIDFIPQVLSNYFFFLFRPLSRTTTMPS